jgi:hypothetical protein
MCDWTEVPHLDEKATAQLLKNIQPYQKAARSRGIPSLGAGAVWPIGESDIKVAPFPIPKHWKRCFGLDTGWDHTAVVWAAYDPDTQTVYIYDVYKRGEVETAVHATAILSRGPWIPGVGDAAAISNEDGEQFISKYKAAGLDIELANKALETGIQEVWDLFVEQRLKIFANCGAWFDEFRLYIRDDKGRIVRVKNHLMDGTRYMVRSGLSRAKTPPADKKKRAGVDPAVLGENAWMIR